MDIPRLSDITIHVDDRMPRAVVGVTTERPMQRLSARELYRIILEGAPCVLTVRARGRAA